MAKVKSFKTKFTEEIIPQLKKILGIKNPMAVPRIKQITINIGVGTFVKAQKKDINIIIENLKKISGQKPVLTKSKKAISNFKIHDNEIIGAIVTLRGKRMYDFLNKLINIVFPRVRDFRGLPRKAFDGHGNYTIGFKEHIVFPEIHPDDIINLHGLQVNLTTTAKSDKDGYELLAAMGFPFQKK